jgi:NADH:ubiquinone oxidoreductase subunit 4 (subunit M)
MIILTAFLTPICIILCWNRSLTYNSKNYIIAFFFCKQYYSLFFQVLILCCFIYCLKLF